MRKGYICRLQNNASKEIKNQIEIHVADYSRQVLFDYNKIIPTDINTSEKLLKKAWGSSENAFLPSYLDHAGYEWFSAEAIPVKVILELSRQYPKVEFHFQAIPTTRETLSRGLNVIIQDHDIKATVPIKDKDRHALTLMLYIQWKPLLQEVPIKVITDPAWDGIQFSF